MPSFPPALAHNAIEEILPDLFFVSGAMETVLMDLDWQFSRKHPVQFFTGRMNVYQGLGWVRRTQ